MKLFLTLLLLIVVGLIISNITLVILGGEQVPEPEIPRESITIGSGEELRYAVVGDSTAIAQGADYSDGYVVNTAEELAAEYEVTYKNFAESGATLGDVVDTQLLQAVNFTPDIVLVAAGANDVTALTPLSEVEDNIKSIIRSLRATNSDIKIVFTGSAAMGTVERFPEPTRALAGLRTTQINNVFQRVANEENVVYADIAGKTRESFIGRPELLAQDNFHPNTEGYAEWTNVLIPVLRNALSMQQ